jgi:DNA repair ATPase RecN
MTLVKRLEALKPFLETHHCRTDTIDDAIAALSSTDGDDGLVERLREEASCWSDADEGSPSSVIHEAANRISSLNAENADLKHDLDRYMKIANIECNEAEQAKARLSEMRDLPRLIELQRTAAPDCLREEGWNAGLERAAAMVAEVVSLSEGGVSR